MHNSVYIHINNHTVTDYANDTLASDLVLQEYQGDMFGNEHKAEPDTERMRNGFR